MGKDTAKILLQSLHTRPHVPYYAEKATTELNRKAVTRFGPSINDTELKVAMDDDVARVIYSIEKAQIEKLKQLREEDTDEDEAIIRQASSLNLFPSDVHSCVKFLIPQQDLQMYTPSSSTLDAKSTPSLHTFVTLKKIREGSSTAEKSSPPLLSATNQNVVHMYQQIGGMFANAELGSILKIHKAIKVIPYLSNWDDILLLTRPENWSPRATFEVTKVFLNNVKATNLKSYFQYVLLYHVRTNLSQNDTLNLYLQNAITKSLESTPGLFIRGFLKPLLDYESCTIKEALAIGSIIHGTRIPAIHSSAALLILTEPRTATSLPVHVLVFAFLLKRPLLDYRAINALVARYFSSSSGSSTDATSTIALPVVWYQSLLIFVESYHCDMVSTHKRKILNFIASIKHNILCKRVEHIIFLTATQSERQALKVAFQDKELDPDNPTSSSHLSIAKSPNKTSEYSSHFRTNEGTDREGATDSFSVDQVMGDDMDGALSNDSAIISYSSFEKAGETNGINSLPSYISSLHQVYGYTGENDSVHNNEEFSAVAEEATPPIKCESMIIDD